MHAQLNALATAVWFVGPDGSLSSPGSLWEVATDIEDLRAKLRQAVPDTALPFEPPGAPASTLATLLGLSCVLAAGWTFEAEFVPVGEACPRRHRVPVESSGDGSYVNEPAGRADTYDVTLFGRGDGDLFVTFRWTTPSDGPMPIPASRLAVLADHDGRVDSYGVELELSNLAATPEHASAEVTVTAANGGSLTFEAIRVPGCIADGTVLWDGPDQAGLDAAALGPAPFTYEVLITLDGVRHTAAAAWPDDEIAGNEPSVSQDFSPALPAVP